MWQFDKSIYKCFNVMMKRAENIQHKTAWFVNDDETTFMFVSVNTETAKKVYDVLRREKLLCDTDLGRFN